MFQFDEKVKIPERLKDSRLFKERIKGMNFGFLSKRGYYDREDVKEQPKLMKEMGVNLSTLNLNVCQETYNSTRLFLDFEYSVGEDELMQMAKNLHEQGIMVALKPCMTCLDGYAMGWVRFPEPDGGYQIQGLHIDYVARWFESYTKCIVACARMAEKMQAEVLMIGAELYGLEHTPNAEKYWRNLIAEVRKVYSGAVTYEFTPDSLIGYDPVWLADLDFLAFSFYPPACPKEHMQDPLNNPTFTKEQMFEYLLPKREYLKNICERYGNLPILFTEYGVRSVHGCIQNPWEIMFRTYYDGEEQANFMAASIDVFKEVPYWMGFCWWKWDETQDRPQYRYDEGDGGFTIQGKPAEKIFREIKL